MTTLVRTPVEVERPRPEPRQEDTTFVCANPDHYRLAARREHARLRDRRYVVPPGIISEHDYCGREETPEPIWFAGRPAFCPLGYEGDNHEWRASEWNPSSRREGAVWP
jgi:hypothetical protein